MRDAIAWWSRAAWPRRRTGGTKDSNDSNDNQQAVTTGSLVDQLVAGLSSSALERAAHAPSVLVVPQSIPAGTAVVNRQRQTTAPTAFGRCCSWSTCRRHRPVHHGCRPQVPAVEVVLLTDRAAAAAAAPLQPHLVDASLPLHRPDGAHAAYVLVEKVERCGGCREKGVTGCGRAPPGTIDRPGRLSSSSAAKECKEDTCIS